jgi:hypothetical protein
LLIKYSTEAFPKGKLFAFIQDGFYKETGE